ncbi:MAG: hypothetical protein GXY34_06600 [Syntrophomonadaceae bacterium]|nr:hypothetical protein [Syntrophomonadaceae bacterium]
MTFIFVIALVIMMPPGATTCHSERQRGNLLALLTICYKLSPLWYYLTT